MMKLILKYVFSAFNITLTSCYLTLPYLSLFVKWSFSSIQSAFIQPKIISVARVALPVCVTKKTFVKVSYLP